MFVSINRILLMWNLALQRRHIFHFWSLRLQPFSRLESVKFVSRGPNMVYFHISHQLLWKLKLTQSKWRCNLFSFFSICYTCNLFLVRIFVMLQRPCRVGISQLCGQFSLVSGKIYFIRVSCNKNFKMLLKYHQVRKCKKMPFSGTSGLWNKQNYKIEGWPVRL